MTDIVDRATRSRMMSAIRGRDTKPELLVRSALHRSGLRFRVNVPGLPGRPDILLPKWKAVVLVHGCYWHRHRGCSLAYTPKSGTAFWKSKFDANVRRDVRVRRNLSALGFAVHVVWECEINESRLKRLITSIRGARK
jgi:DNA mismatch endonuclease, patch repair protein